MWVVCALDPVDASARDPVGVCLKVPPVTLRSCCAAHRHGPRQDQGRRGLAREQSYLEQEQVPELHPGCSFLRLYLQGGMVIVADGRTTLTGHNDKTEKNIGVMLRRLGSVVSVYRIGIYMTVFAQATCKFL